MIIGILAALAIPKFSRSRSMTYSAAIRQDLRTLSVAQEDYFLQYNIYANNPANLNFLHSPGVTITINQATAMGWSATGTHPMAYPITCAVFWGPVTPVTPATVEGQVDCQ
ncbi:MAG: pilin [Gemmatimonadetes bacterium]|nr:pilin [Gemmatimonadota bacterium]